jgi:hypothetical protein
VKDWSDIYAERKRKHVSGVYGNIEESYENEIPEMLSDSIAFDIQGRFNVLDGCYADTAETGYGLGANVTMIGCHFFNNKMMGLKNSTAIRHAKGDLTVIACVFRGTAGKEILYDGPGESVTWVGNTSSGGEGMQSPFA